MNNFTKEELEFILDGTRHWCNKNIPTPWVFDFKNKIESMIENYCEHEWENHCCGVIDAPCVCSKCGINL